MTEAVLFTALEYYATRPFTSGSDTASTRSEGVPLNEQDETTRIELLMNSLSLGLDGMTTDDIAVRIHPSPARTSLSHFSLLEAVTHFNRQKHEQSLIARRKDGVADFQISVEAISTGSLDIVVDAANLFTTYAPSIYLALPDSFKLGLAGWVLRCFQDGLRTGSRLASEQIAAPAPKPEPKPEATLRDVEDTFERLSRGNKFSSMSVTVGQITITGIRHPKRGSSGTTDASE